MKLPIIILSSKRTGSTALMNNLYGEIKKDNNVQLFCEPSQNNLFSGPFEHNTLLDLLKTIEKNDSYIVKAHAYDFLKDFPDCIKDIVVAHSCFLVRIRRKNLVNQVASHYLASQNNIWGHSQSITHTPSLPIDIERIHNSIKVISVYNDAIDNFPAKFDLDTFYEDLILSNQMKTVETPKPDNYNLILQTIQNII